MGTLCAILAYSLLYSYETKFRQKLIKDKRIAECKTCIVMFRYNIDDFLSINNPNFANWISLVYP